MNRLVTAGPENGGAKYLFCPGVHDNLHEAPGFSLFDGSTDPAYRPLSGQDRPASLCASASVIPTRPKGGSI